MNTPILCNCLSKTLYSSVLTILCFLFCYDSSASSNSQAQLTLTERIQSFEQKMEYLRKELKIPGMSVAVLQKQKVVFARGFGFADLESEIPATENIPYHIASLTKPFSAALIMQLVESGELNLDDTMANILKDAFLYRDETIQGYASLCKIIKKLSKDESSPYVSLFQDYNGDTERITVRHHLTHTSQGKPGEEYRYNGFLFGLLTPVIETVSKRDFEELLVEKVIAPLDMTSTVPSSSNSLRQRVLAERAKPYRLDDEENFALSEYPSSINTAAGMVSTVLDLAKFDVAMDRNQIVSEESKEAMFKPNLSNSGHHLPYSIGWFVQEHEDFKFVWHYGWQPDAYSSLILKVPEKKTTLMLLANSEGASAPFNLGEGNVLNSPFAVSFLNLFTDIHVSTPLPKPK